jgi:hypothetical protein
MDNNSWNPFADYTELKEEYLSTVADIIRQARTAALKRYDAAHGDDSWVHGVTAFAWSKFALTEGTKEYPWLTSLDAIPRLRATFAICGRPFRFDRGMPEEPPSRYLTRTFAEIRQFQLVLKFDGAGSLDKILRIAVETNEQGETTDVTLVEVDKRGRVTNSYLIPLAIAKSNVVPAQANAVDVPPPTVVPKKSEQQQQKAAEQAKKKKNG